MHIWFRAGNLLEVLTTLCMYVRNSEIPNYSCRIYFSAGLNISDPRVWWCGGKARQRPWGVLSVSSLSRRVLETFSTAAQFSASVKDCLMHEKYRTHLWRMLPAWCTCTACSACMHACSRADGGALAVIVVLVVVTVHPCWRRCWR